MPKGGPDFTARGKPRKVASPRGGRPVWKPNDEQRMLITALAGRATQEVIAKMVGTTVDTLAKHCRAELDLGTEVAYANIESVLYREAIAGNMTALIWYEKSRRRFREVTTHEHSGPGGAPIEHRDMSGYTDDQLAILEQAAALLGDDTSADGGKSPPVAG